MVTGGHPPTEEDLLELQFGPNPYAPRSSHEARLPVVWSALERVGYSDPETYWRMVGILDGNGNLSHEPPFPPEWCGGFSLSRLWKGELCRWPWVIDPANRHWGYCWRLPTTRDPLPGDTAYFAKHQHHALVVGDGRLVNGNGAGGEVTVSWVRPGHEPDVYYSIAPLVQRYDQ